MNTHQRTIATSAIPSPPQAASSPRDKTGKPGRPKNPRRELLVINIPHSDENSAIFAQKCDQSEVKDSLKDETHARTRMADKGTGFDR